MLRLLPILLLTAAGCLAKDSGRPLGQRCSGDGECRSGLHCQYGRCRQACTYDRDCEAGAVCVPSVGDPSVYVCTLPDEGGGAACPEGLSDDGTGACRRPCDPSGPQPESVCGPAQTCDLGWCRATDIGDAGPPGPGDGGDDGGDSGVDARGGSGGGSDGAPDGGGDGGTGEPTVPGPWVLIDVSGTPFTMGSSVGELGHQADEMEHAVTLTRDYWLMTTEITQQQFLDVMGYNPARFRRCGLDCPVEQVKWHEVASYTNELSRLEGLGECYECNGTAPATISCLPSGSYGAPYDCPGYRLPTEAEWEYAARGGTTTATYNGNLDNLYLPSAVVDLISWYDGNSRGRTNLVGIKDPNTFGLHDMLGNVWEWCNDWYNSYSTGSGVDPSGPTAGQYRVHRGGSWAYPPLDNRAAGRVYAAPSEAYDDCGGRVARTL